MYSNDFLWSVYEPCVSDLSARLKAYAKHISAGPAEDAARRGLPIAKDGGVAVVPVMGMMLRRVHPMLAELFGLASTEAIRSAVIAADQDEDVREIILRVDSPGGSVSGLRELADTISNTETRVTAQVEGMAASAAYYIASQADEILVGKTDLVGSIGTRMMLYDFSKAFEEEGIEPVPIDTGEFKSAGAMGTEITERQRAEFQRIVDFFFDDFVNAVATGRNMTDEQVREIGDGRMYTPDQAIELGLVDGIATIEETLSNKRQSGRSTEAARAKLRLAR